MASLPSGVRIEAFDQRNEAIVDADELGRGGSMESLLGRSC